MAAMWPFVRSLLAGIFEGGPAGGLSRIALASQAPDLPSAPIFPIVADNPTVNSSGAVAFSSSYSGGSVSGTGAFSNATGPLQSVVLPETRWSAIPWPEHSAVSAPTAIRCSLVTMA